MDQEEDLLGSDEEVEEQIEWEEELENLYGQKEEEPKEKKMGPGFSKQTAGNKPFQRKPKIKITYRGK
ncbi:MAG: hypothetical protein AAB791_01005 [Patescibacteria group bacterium]